MKIKKLKLFISGVILMQSFAVVAYSHDGGYTKRNGKYVGCYNFVFENVWSQSYVPWADNTNEGHGSIFNTGVIASDRDWSKACVNAQSALPPTSLHENFVHTYSVHDPENGVLGACRANVRYIIGYGPWLEDEADTKLSYNWRHEHVEPKYPEIPPDTFVLIDGKLYYRTYYCDELEFVEVPSTDEAAVCEL